MRRIVKSELIKWFSGKMIYISMLITALLVAIDFVATRLLASHKPQTVPGLAEKIQFMSSQEYIVNSMVNLLAGGTVFIIISIITATLVTEDYSRGTLKYSLLATSREKLMMGKIIASGIINFSLIVAALVSSSIIGIIGYDWSQGSYTILQIVMICFLGWLTITGFSLLLMFALGRINKVSGAIGLGIGIFMLTGVMGVVAPESLKGLIIGVNFSEVAALETSTLDQIFISGSMYVLIFSILNVLSFRNKEIIY